MPAPQCQTELRGLNVDNDSTTKELGFQELGLQKSFMVAKALEQHRRSSIDSHQPQEEALDKEPAAEANTAEEPATVVSQGAEKAEKEESEGFTRSISLYWHWVRGQKAAARLGKGLARSTTALILQCEHWLEAADPKHRYGTNLRPYFDYWLNQQAKGRDAATTRHTCILYSAIPEIAAQAAAEANSQANNNNAEASEQPAVPTSASGAGCGDDDRVPVTTRRSRSAPNLADLVRNAVGMQVVEEDEDEQDTDAACMSADDDGDTVMDAPAADHDAAAAEAADVDDAAAVGSTSKHKKPPVCAVLQHSASANLAFLGGRAAPLPGIHTDDRFFYWLDEGAGRHVDLADRGVPRGKLESERVQYLTESERDQLEVTVDTANGLLVYKQSGQTVHTGSELSLVQKRSPTAGEPAGAVPASNGNAAAAAATSACHGSSAAGNSWDAPAVHRQGNVLQQIPEAAPGEEDDDEDENEFEQQDEDESLLGSQQKQQRRQQQQQLQQMQETIRHPMQADWHRHQHQHQHEQQQCLQQTARQLAEPDGQLGACADTEMQDVHAELPAVAKQLEFSTPSKAPATAVESLATPSAAAYGAVAGHATPGTTCISQRQRPAPGVDAHEAADAGMQQPLQASLQQQELSQALPQQQDLPQPVQQQPAQQLQPADASHGTPAGLLQIKEKPCKWIYVLDTAKRLFVHAKYRGKFHHSSFLQGGAVLSAGGIVVEHGRIMKLTADSGHYRPNFDSFMMTVQLLKDWGADLTQTKLSAKHIKCPQLPEFGPS